MGNCEIDPKACATCHGQKCPLENNLTIRNLKATTEKLSDKVKTLEQTCIKKR